MAEQRPLVLIDGKLALLPLGDSLPGGTPAPSSGTLIDGGSPSTDTSSPTLKIDFGGVQ